VVLIEGVRYLEGGVASGFAHVDPDAVEKKLLQVKGKRNVRVREVPLDVSSMNRGDCFVLDCGKTIYVYMGSSSKKIESLKAIQAANQVRDQDHAGKAKIVILGTIFLLLGPLIETTRACNIIGSICNQRAFWLVDWYNFILMQSNRSIQQRRRICVVLQRAWQRVAG